jgi:integrase
MYRMAQLANMTVFLPAVLCCGTRRNAIWLPTCKRTTYLFSHGRVKTEILGHSHISITLGIYGHVLPGMHEEAMDRMGKLFCE